MSVGNPESPRYAGVDTEHPTIKEYIKNCAKQGQTKEHAAKISGMPREVVERIYKEEGK